MKIILSAQCTIGNLATQSAIDNFSTNYSGCTPIDMKELSAGIYIFRISVNNQIVENGKILITN